jgi:hypothetical protein
MRTRRGDAMRLGAAAALLVAVGVAGCGPDRLRPGPPTLSVELPPGNTVFSPDTLNLVIRASDPNGLDSVTVTILGVTEEVDAFDRTETVGLVRWPIPAGLVPGETVAVRAYAKDLVGERTTVDASVTVVARSPARTAAQR